MKYGWAEAKPWRHVGRWAARTAISNPDVSLVRIIGVLFWSGLELRVLQSRPPWPMWPFVGVCCTMKRERDGDH